MKLARITTCAALAAAVALCAATAFAQTVYKLIDKNGKVTYVQDPPKYYEGKVIRIDIDPNANKATLQSPNAARNGEPPVPGAKPQAKEQSAKDKRLHEAQDRLEQAKQALNDAREHPGEDDLRWMGNAGGGTRQVHTEAYDQRLANLEKAVKEAEDALRSVERGR